LLAGALALLHVIALFSVLSSLDAWTALLVSSGVVFSAVAVIGEALQIWPSSALELELRGDGSAGWRDRRGTWHDGTVARSRHVSYTLVTLALSGQGRRRRWLVLLPDSAAAEDFRKLRLWLRLRAAGPDNSPHPE
jgi:toxin CptA